MPLLGLWQKIKGTTETVFQIGLNGPNVKNNAGALEARNAGDNAFAVLRAGAPAAGDDLTTKAYVDGLSGSAVREIRLPIALASVASASKIPANGIITEVLLNVITPYSGGATMQAGLAGTLDALFGTSDVNLQQVGAYRFSADLVWGALAGVTVTLAGAPTAGASTLTVKYAVPDT